MSVTQGPWRQEQRPASLETFKPFSPTAWLSKEAPRLDWMVQGAIVRGSVGIMAGDGGLGKSLLLQQLMTACCLGLDWLGMHTDRCRSLAVFCEDDLDELHRRQERINHHYGCSMKDLDGMLIESRAGRESVIMRFPRWGGAGERLGMFDQIRHAAKEHGCKLVILDTLADVFDGNEIDRNQPRVFIRELRKLALELQGCVILTQHPSIEGMNSGSGRSGSTGWHNSVRSRMYLTMPKGDKEDGGNRRVLKTMKQNYGKSGGAIDLVWDKGVFKVEQPDRFAWSD